MESFIQAFDIIQKDIPVIFPVHPRTLKNLHVFNLMKHLENMSNLIIENTLGYYDFMRLTSGAKIVITDSGGIQEETTVLKIPCITIRENTERPLTVEMGSNVVIGKDTKMLLKYVKKALQGEWKEVRIPDKWDGKTANRVVDTIYQRLKYE